MSDADPRPRIGVLHVGYDLLAKLLRLPEGAAILAVTPSTPESNINGRLEVVVSGRGLPEHTLGTPLVRVTLTVRSDGSAYFE